MIKGLKKAVGEYKKYNEGGQYSPEYGVLMFDTSTNEVWTDYFYSIGHNNYKVYEDKRIINLGKIMEKANIDVTMQNVKAFAEEIIIFLENQKTTDKFTSTKMQINGNFAKFDVDIDEDGNVSFI